MKKKITRRRRVRKMEQDSSLIATSPGEFINRELSWLEFNRRVLAEAQDTRNPLLERVRFLAIFTNNLDEFFMNRIGRLKQKIAAGVVGASFDGLTSQQQLAAIREVVLGMLKERSECLEKSILPALRAEHIELLEWHELNEAERREAEDYYRQNIFPILTPQAVDPGHPFPFISNLSLSLGIILKHPDREENFFARVKIPMAVPQLLRLSSSDADNTARGTLKYRFIRTAAVVEQNLASLFPGMQVTHVMPFRVTRNAEIDVDDYDAEDILEVIEEELKERRFARAVRLEHGPSPDADVLQFLIEEMDLKSDDVYENAGHPDFLALREIADLNLPNLKYEPWSAPAPVQWLDEEVNLFSIIRNNDVLVSHPYESFAASVERFLRAAVEDPKVLAIKLTLYRAGELNPIVPLLILAAEREKQVVVSIEVKAHFDEARNIRLAQTLEETGVHVMYGVIGLKTHAKVILVARQEPDGIRCYTHLSTGNYNHQTARVYTDIGLFTSRPEITDDVIELFHYLTGRSLKREYRRLLVAPHNMREHFMALIEQEIAHAQAGKEAVITVKVNSLEDPEMSRALIKAAQQGVMVNLIVRGICCLRPPKDLSNLRVISIIGRFLEHSRLIYFRNGAADPIDGSFFIASADWMYRNLNRRVEVAVPILGRTERESCWTMLQIMMEDLRQAWELDAEGKYHRRHNGKETVGTHAAMMKLTREKLRLFQPGAASAPKLASAEALSVEAARLEDGQR